MEKTKSPYEQASQELNEFRERRIAERRSKPRGTPDRRRNQDSGCWPFDESSSRRNLH